jgi:hypothetical protein
MDASAREGPISRYQRDIRSRPPWEITVALFALGFFIAELIILIFSFLVEPEEGFWFPLLLGIIATCAAAFVGLGKSTRWGWWVGIAISGFILLVLAGALVPPVLRCRETSEGSPVPSWGGPLFVFLIYGLPLLLSCLFLVRGKQRYYKTEAPPGLWKRGRYPVIATLLTVLMGMTLLGIFVIWPPRLLWASWRNHAELHRRHDRYEEIVRRISAVRKEPGSILQFGVSIDRDPNSLMRLDSAMETENYDLHKQGRLIMVQKGIDGGLRVEFIGRDYGHLAVFSLVYDDSRSRPYFPPGVVVSRVAPQWWAVEDFTR